MHTHLTRRAALPWIAAALWPGLGRAEPDEAALGKAQGYPPPASLADAFRPEHRIAAFGPEDPGALPGYRVRAVARAERATPLVPHPQPPAIRYRHRNLGYSLDEYLDRQRCTGLLILKDGQVVAERYRYERKPQTRFISFSMAKSVTALLVGIALERGAIASLDDAAQKYVRGLEGSAYGATTVRHLLRMSSGITFTERYDGSDDIARLSRAFVAGGSLELLRSFSDRHGAPGAKFAYSSAETFILGLVLAGATGRSVSELTADWLWKPLGTEADGYWRISAEGQEGTHGFFHATLRDWARLGWMLAGDGEIGGRRIVARDYLLEATDVQRQPEALRPYRATPWAGYGYQFWLSPLKERTFQLQGIHGQGVYVQPASGIVMVHTAAFAPASGRQDSTPFEERDALWRGVLASLGGQTA